MPYKIETAEDLEQIVDQQTEAITALGELVKGMDTRIRALTALVDHHHEILGEGGQQSPRPQRPVPRASLAQNFASFQDFSVLPYED